MINLRGTAYLLTWNTSVPVLNQNYNPRFSDIIYFGNRSIIVSLFLFIYFLTIAIRRNSQVY